MLEGADDRRLRHNVGGVTAAAAPGELLTRRDVCHLHVDRAAAERCGALLGGTPDLLRLETQSERVYRVVWSLSDASGGELRRPVLKPVPPATPFNAPRLAP